MLLSAVAYAGLLLMVAGLVLVVRPVHRLGITSRLRASLVMDAGIILAVIALFAPTRESRVRLATTRLDGLMPAWHFRELHTIRIAAPPDRVFAAIEAVRADEISLFRTLTWIRRGGRPLPESILNAGNRWTLPPARPTA